MPSSQSNKRRCAACQLYTDDQILQQNAGGAGDNYTNTCAALTV